MATGSLRLRVPAEAARRLLSRKTGVSRGIDKVIEKYRVESREDVLGELIGERR